MTKNTLADIPTDALIAELAALDASVDVMLTRQAHILAELKARKQWHDLMKHDVLKWFQEIADGDLHPAMVRMFCARPMILKSCKGAPFSDQLRWVAGDPVRVAEYKPGPTPEPKVVEKRLNTLSDRDVKVAFEPGKGLRGDRAQITELKRVAPLKRAAKPKGPTVVALKREGVLSVGGVKVKPEALIAALGTLGYRLTKKVDA